MELYQQAVEIARDMGCISSCTLERRLGLSRWDALQLMHKMERNGILAPENPNDVAAPRGVVGRNSYANK